MTDDDRVVDFMTGDFTSLRHGGPRGLEELRRSGRSYGVVVDKGGRPVQLLGPDGLKPLAQVGPSTPMAALTDPGLIALIADGAPGLVVADHSGPIGILVSDTIAGYLQDSFGISTETMGDSDLAGDPPPLTRLHLTCETCGTVNDVPFFVGGKTQCSNGHVLAVTWE